MVILVVAIFFAKLAYAYEETRFSKLNEEFEFEFEEGSVITATSDDEITEPTCRLLDKSESRDANKITPRKYIARRVIAELSKAGYTLTPQKVSI